MAKALLCLGTLSTLTVFVPGEWPVLLIESALLVLSAFALPAARANWVVAAPALWGVLQLSLDGTILRWAVCRSILLWLTVAAIYWTTTSILAKESLRRNFLRLCAAVAVGLCAVSLVQFFTSSGKHFWVWAGAEPQIFGPFQSRNNFATYAVLLIPIVLWQGITVSRNAWPWLAGAALMIGAVTASGSRAGTALMVVELIVFAVLARKRVKRATATLVISLSLASIAVAGWTHLAGKLSGHNPLRYRREMIASALEMARDRPVLGHGLGTYSTVYPRYAQFDSGHRVNHAHDDWAEWAAEGGFPLPGLLIIFMVLTIPSVLHQPWAIGLPFVCAHALVDYPFQRLGIAFWFVVIAAAARCQESATFGTAASNNHG